MAFTFVQYASAGAQATSVTCNKPTGTSDNDIMLACIVRRGGTADPTTAPTGWTQLCKRANFDGADTTAWIYYRVASSEGASYQWIWADGLRTQVVIASYREFDTADPIDVYSDTPYNTSNTTVRSASMTLSAAGTPVVNFAIESQNLSSTFTPPTNFTERCDVNDGYRTSIEVSDYVYASSGATGDIDATCSSTLTAKHGFAVALNPAAAGATAYPSDRGMYRGMFRGMFKGTRFIPS